MYLYCPDTPRIIKRVIFFFWCSSSNWGMAVLLLRFIDVSLSHSLTHTHTHTLGRTFLDEWSARCGGRYLHNISKHKRRTSIPSAAFEPAIPGIEAACQRLRPNSHWDRRLDYLFCFSGARKKGKPCYRANQYEHQLNIVTCHGTLFSFRGVL